MAGKYKAIILAAGEGTRLKRYTQGLPKGMLDFAGKPLIARQIETLRTAGIEDISVVRGFKAGKIDFPGVNYYENRDYSDTNMLVSLFCAGEKLNGDLIVSYADILYEPALLRKMMEHDSDIAVAVDMNWRKYWEMRYGTVNNDLESLVLHDGLITALGEEDPPIEKVDARYVGLLKFSEEGTRALWKIWEEYKDEYWDRPWQVSGKPFRKAYMTDMVQALIDKKHEVHAVATHNGWIEFDTNEDYEQAIDWHKTGEIKRIINIADGE